MLRISLSVSRAEMNDTVRGIALEMISILSEEPEDTATGESSKYYLDFPGVDADEVIPGIFIGNK